MKVKLAELLGDEVGRAHAAVDTLRAVVALRVGQQHQEPDIRAEQARVSLGLAPYAGDWEGSCNHLKLATVQAVDTIRERSAVWTTISRACRTCRTTRMGTGLSLIDIKKPNELQVTVTASQSDNQLRRKSY